MMKDGLPIIGLLAFLGLGLLVPAGAPGIVPLQSGSEAAYIAEIREHRRKREERLRAPFSPLALVHREYLNERAQITLGTGPNVDVKLNDPAVAPLHAQLDARFSPPILRAQGTARFARFEMRAEPLAELRLDDGQAFRLGRYELRYIVHVSWGPTLEVYDPGLPALRNFQGLPFFPIDPAYRLDAEVVPFAQAEPIELLDSHGNQRPYWLYGELRFQLHGVACQLELYTDTTDPAEIEKQEFMLIFADATSGQETYPAARYLYVEGRARGSVPVDFNKAFNPPCVFSAVYTCPFPRPRNRLAIPVRAGELWYKTPPNAARWLRYLDEAGKNLMPLKEGDHAPEFTLPADDGTSVSLNDFRGRNLVLYFFPKASTPGWTLEAREFRDAVEALQKKNAVVLGCSADPPEVQAKFKKRWKLNFPLLSDTEKETLEAYGVWQQKSFLGKKYMGVARWTFVIGPDGRIRKIFQKVRPGRHAAEVLAALD